MASRIVRRSANSVIEYLNLIGWVPKNIVMIGVGVTHEEADAFKEVWPNTDIIGFEPNSDSCNGIRKSFPGRLHEFAVSCTRTSQRLYSRNNWKNGSSLYQPDDSFSKVRIVDCRMLDDCIEDSRDQILLWLDCEGSELDVLKSGTTLLEVVDVVNVEMTGIPRGQGWAKPIEIHRWLTNRGFLQSWIHTTRPSLGQFDAIYVRQKLFKPEFCCCMDSIDGSKK